MRIIRSRPFICGLISLITDSSSSFQVRRCSTAFAAATMGDSHSVTAGDHHPQSLRILFCGTEFPDAETYTRHNLLKYPHLHVEVWVLYDGQLDSWRREEVPEKIADYDICVPKMMRLDEAVISRAKRLRLIVQFGVGLEGVDVQAATRAGIRVARIPSANTGNALSCAEHSIYLLLGLLRNQNGMASAVRERRLGEPTGETLYGKTVFILGYGNIGKELAIRLRAFGVHILAVRRSWSGIFYSNNIQNQKGTQIETLQSIPDADDLVHEKGGTEHILKFASRADIVVVCCLLNPSTKGIVNAAFLSTMKKGAHVVNVARGGLLDYDAVTAALDSGHLGGLAIDVTWSEPFDPLDPILKYPNVLITPHVAGVTTKSYQSMGKAIADSAYQFSIGAPMPALEVVN